MTSRLIRVLLIFLLSVLMFVFGFGYGARTGALGEMSAFEIVFVGNSGILAECQKVPCEARLRDMVVSTNEVALTNFDSLEKLRNANWFTSNIGFGLRGFAMITTNPITRSSNEWRSMLRKQ